MMDTKGFSIIPPTTVKHHIMPCILFYSFLNFVSCIPNYCFNAKFALLPSKCVVVNIFQQRYY